MQKTLEKAEMQLTSGSRVTEASPPLGWRVPVSLCQLPLLDRFLYSRGGNSDSEQG